MQIRIFTFNNRKNETIKNILPEKLSVITVVLMDESVRLRNVPNLWLIILIAIHSFISIKEARHIEIINYTKALLITIKHNDHNKYIKKSYSET